MKKILFVVLAGVIAGQLLLGCGRAGIPAGDEGDVTPSPTPTSNPDDTTVPVVSVLSPADGALLGTPADRTPGGALDIEVIVAVYDLGLNTEGQTVTLNDGTTDICSGPVINAAAVLSCTFADGDHTLTATVTDLAENVGTMTIDITVDTIPPMLVFNGVPTTTQNDPIDIDIDTDAADGTMIHLYTNNQLDLSMPSAAGTVTFPNVASDTGPFGSRTIYQLRATDAAGNETISDVHVLQFDNG